ncbi:MAG: glycosyltransferase [Acidobacteriota bacterium]|nr:glycosyltransferase [Acidobacteriota bacterium]
MKVVRIIARLNVGGPTRHVVWLTKELQDQGFQSILVTGTVPEGEEDMSYFAFENGVKPIFIPEMSREISLKDFISFVKICRILFREKPDLIHTHTAKAGTLGRLAGLFYRWFTFKALICKPRSVKIVHTYHGHIFHSYYGSLKTKVFLFIERLLAVVATDKIVVISRKQFEEIHEKFRVGRASQFAIIPLGINLEVFQTLSSKRQSVREEFGASDNEVLVGIVGRLTEIKNHELFLKVAKICKQKSERLRFLIVGDGHLRRRLESLVSDFGLERTVTFVGNRNDLDFYAGLDVVALTSLNEGTPLSLIEAMACGIPVISTMVGGVFDLLGQVVEEKDGFYVCERGIGVGLDKENLEKAFSSGLIYLIEDEHLRKKFAKVGKSYVFSCYSKERLVKDIVNLYENLTFQK